MTHKRAVIGFWKDNSEFWTLKKYNSERVYAQLLGTSLITHVLIVLRFRCEDNSKISIILSQQSLCAQDYRRLAVYLYHCL